MFEKMVEIVYTNWKSETRKRVIIPLNIEYKSTQWHKKEQWILEAIDVEKDEKRGFAIADIGSWNNIQK